MRNYQQTLDWYKSHQTTKQIGFNPNGMCLKVCRVARGLPAVYPTAKVAQDATPKDHRVYKVRDLRRGMVLYFDDPNDSNRAGHVVTMIGRVKGFNPDSLHDILVETNTVKSGEVVVVRATYFKKYWGDSFQFGANWLNGHELDIPKPKTRLQKFHASSPNYDLKHLDNAIRYGKRVGLKDERDTIVRLVGLLPAEEHGTRVAEFVDEFRRRRVLRMPLLDDAVNLGKRTGAPKRIRDAIRATIKSLPRT